MSSREVLEILNKYPKELTKDELKSLNHRRFFYFPSFAIRKLNNALTQSDYLVLSILSYMSHTSVDNSVIETPLISIDSIMISGCIGTRNKQSVLLSLENLEDLGVVALERKDDNNLFRAVIDISHGFSKINTYEYEQLITIKNHRRKMSMTVTYLSINATIYRKEGSFENGISNTSRINIASNVGVSVRNFSRIISELQDMKIIAQYEVYLKNRSNTIRTILSCYYERDKLRRYVEYHVLDEKGSYTTVINNKREEQRK